MAKNTGPLTEEHFTLIKEGLSNLNDAEAEADRAARAGIDVGDAKKQIADLRRQFTQIGNAYFTGRNLR